MERVLTVGGNAATRPITDFLIGNIGTEYYVCSVTGDDGRSGRSKETCLATLAEAFDRVTASKNDVIYLLPGHAETVATAGAIALDVIGVRVIGVGKGALRPTFTFSATDSTITMTAASTSLENCLIIPSVDSVVSPIVVSAANCKVDVEVRDTTDIECVTAILTTAGADNLDINLKYVGYAAGNACLAPIQLVGVDTARIYVDFFGVAATAVVNFITTACHNIDITGLFYNIGTSLTKNVIDTEGNGTWSVRGWDGNSNANFSGGDNAALASDDAAAIAAAVATAQADLDILTGATGANLLTATQASIDAIEVDTGTTIPGTITTVQADLDIITGATGVNLLTATQASIDAIEVDTGTTIPGTITTAQADLDILTGATGANLLTATQASIDAIEADTAAMQPSAEMAVSSSTAVMANGNTIFTIAGGPIEVLNLISVCITSCDATGATLQYSADPTVGAAITFSGASASLTSFAAGGAVVINMTALNTAPDLSVVAVALGPVQTNRVIINEGIITIVIGSGPTTGTFKHYLRYRPLGPGVTVVGT